MGIEYDSKSEDIGRIIEMLFCIENETDFEKICSELDAIYLDAEGKIEENFRHEYSGISGKIRELIEYEEDGINPYVLHNLVDNIGYLYDYAVEQKKEYIKSLFKLKDHISLEAGRIELVEQLKWEIINSKESVAIQLDDLHHLADDLEGQISESAELISAFKHQSRQSETELEKLEVRSKDIADKMEDVQRDSITILGIFASIVLSFTAGIGFSSSVLENLHLSSPYRIMAVVIGLALFIINVVCILLAYIDKIKSVSAKEVKYPVFLIVLDVLLVVALVVDFIAFKLRWFTI